MVGSILVTGATGRLGRFVVRGLLERGQPVRALTRRPEVAASLFGRSVEIASGDFADARSLERAFTSIDRVLLLSPISEHLARHQIAVIDAAETAGVERIVKVSGSDWTIDPPGRSISGALHAEVEARLTASPISSVALRPNGWMQVGLSGHVANLKAGRLLTSGYGRAKVGFIDARDIADVAIQQLLAPKLALGNLVLTGGESLSVEDIASIAGRRLNRAVDVAWVSPSLVPVDFEQRALGEFIRLIAEGRAADLTDTVERLLGRPPRTAGSFLAEHLEAVAA